MSNLIVIIVVAVVLIIFSAFSIFSLLISKKVFFCAFPRLAAFGDPNKMRFIHLNGFFFIISNDIWCKDIVYQNEAVNMMFQYNLRSTMNATEILNNKKPLNIEMFDTVSKKQMSYTVPHNCKPQAIRFFNKYRELMNRINQHKMTGN